jgi:hypothetical protein
LGGAPVTLAGDSDSKPDDAFWGIAVDEAYAYFTTGRTTYQGKRSVARVPKTGGAVETIVSNVQQASAVSVDRGELYILDGGGVFRAPVTGGTAAAMPEVGGHPRLAHRRRRGRSPATVVATSIGDFPAALARVRDQVAVAGEG